MFKVPQEVGPFIIKLRTTLPKIEGLMKGMNFEHARAWRYDPHGVMFNKLTGKDKEDYRHKPSPILQGITNKESLEEVRDLSFSGNFEQSQQSEAQKAAEKMQDQ